MDNLMYFLYGGICTLGIQVLIYFIEKWLKKKRGEKNEK